MIKLTHNSCTDVSGNLVVEPLLKQATTNVNASATTLIVSWNSKNLRMFSRMDRPHFTDATMPATTGTCMPSVLGHTRDMAPATKGAQKPKQQNKTHDNTTPHPQQQT